MNNSVVIITGSTKGIGRSVAKYLIKNGAAVIINGRSREGVENTVKRFKEMGGYVAGLTGSVENPKTGKKLVELAIKRFGKITCLINNAGTIQDKLINKMSDEEFSSVIDIHVKGAFYCSRAFIQQIKVQETGGQIINMTSDSGLKGNIGQVNYSSAKAAINGMTWTLAKELKKDGIIVNAIAPAALTDMTRPYLEKAKKRAAEKGGYLPKAWEIGEPDDVASFIINLIKNADMNKTGQIFGVNGKKLVLWIPPYPNHYS